MTKPGRVFLVGAGPGDPELLTLKALRCLAAAEVVVFDRLVSDEVLALAPRQAMMIPVGKAPGHHPVGQQEISALLVELGRQGQRVVRLKGGDPFIFGRGAEEAAALAAAGVPHEIVAGITAAQGAAAAAGVPLTHRGLATGVRYVAGHCRRDLPLELDWRGLADPATTLVVYMGADSIGLMAGRLIAAGAARTLPVLAIAAATTPGERRLLSTLEHVAREIEGAALQGPVLFIAGRVVSLYRGEAMPEVACPVLLERAEAAGHA